MKKFMRSSFFVLAMALPIWGGMALAADQGPVSLKSFGSVPILDEGRVKPLESYAKARLLQFSGKPTYRGEPATSWLARVLFDPLAAQKDLIFRVDRGEVLDALGLPRAEKLRYSFNDLEPALGALQDFARTALGVPDNERSAFQKALLRLYHNVNLFFEMQGALSFARPQKALAISDPAAASRMGLLGNEVSWLDLRRRIPNLLAEIERPAPAPSVLAAAEAMQEMGKRFGDFNFAVLPPVSSPGARSPWQSPWAALSKSPEAAAITACEPWAQMNLAYLGKNTDLFQKSLALHRAQLSGQPSIEKILGHVKLEVTANHLAAFDRARLFYILGFFLVLVSMLLSGKGSLWTRRGAWGLVAAALAFHVTGLVLRMALTGRPPVTNLYESMLFVAFVMAALSLLLERMKTGGMGLMASTLCGAGILFLAGRFATDGDTLKVLVAVLDSNFWLSTHVLAISVGYSGVILSGVMAHLYFIRALFQKNPQTPSLAPLVYGTQAFGLIFTFTGTMLGGVWADQSWGRFWGWDPKENGALMIVIWGAMLFHARLAGWVKDAGFAAGAMLGMMVVSFAWFGVNFLGVGLHAYGFTDGARTALYGYWALQAVLTAAALYGAWLKEGPKKA